MRKTLLVATALSAGWMGSALAQGTTSTRTTTTTDTTTTPALPAPQPMPTQGVFASKPSASPPAGANNNNNTAATPIPGAVANPTPGTVVIHFNGRVTTEVNAVWSNLDRGSFPAQLGAGNGTLTPAGNYKTNPLNISNYARIYTGLDAMAANGLRYGAAIEIRENFTGSAPNNAGTGASGYSSAETLFVRRAFGYVAADNVGIFRFGQGDGLISLYDNGVTTFQFLPGGNLNGGDLQSTFPGGAFIPFANFAVSGNEYTYNKLVYMSPQFAGFDFGVSWAPNTTNGFGQGTATAFNTIGGCPYANPNCPNLSSSSNAGDTARLTNLVQVGARYQGKFDALGVLAYGVYQFSGNATFTGARTPAAQTFNGQSFGNIGVALTYAGFTVGGNWLGGAANGQAGPKPSGAPNQQAWVAGVTYKTGPWIVGVTGEQIQSQGSPALTGRTQRYEYAIDGGAAYTVAPGIIAYAEYMYQYRKQNGFNFANSSLNGQNNVVSGQGLQVGTTIYW